MTHTAFLSALMAILVLGAGGCASTPSDRPEPAVRTITVQVPVPVPCPALVELGPEPEYVDTAAALAAANIAQRARLYVAGRAQRIARLAEYNAARMSCIF